MKSYYKYSYLIIALMLAIISCDSSREHHTSHDQNNFGTPATLISEQGKVAGGAYFSKDNNGLPLLCWTEETEQEGEFVLQYARFTTSDNRFGKPVRVVTSKGTRLHSESMNKVAVKKDGTLVAVYAVKHPTPANRFAGSIFYTLSADQGKNWSKPAYLHSDTLPDYGRGYFDLELLPDGEIGAVWLDGRLGEGDTGSALFFARTEPGKGFGKDWQIGESTCECCRTDLFVDNMGGIHVAYRAILFSSALMGQQVRDIVHSVSHDGGQTFGAAKRVSADNWAIEGCPHTGPSLAANHYGLHAVWFTAGGDQGLFHVNSNDGNNFSPRSKISGNARHPQITSLKSGVLALVWDELASENSNNKVLASTQSQQHGNHSTNTGGTKVVLQTRENDAIIKTMSLSSPQVSASSPFIIPYEGKLIVAWTEEDQNNSGVFYKMVEMP